MPINNHLDQKKCIDVYRYILPKLSTACFAVRRLFHIRSIDVLRMAYIAYFHSIMKYGVIFSGNSTNICCVCTLQNRIIRIISDVGANSSRRNLFKKLDLFPVSCLYILSLMMIVVDFIRKFCRLTYLYLDQIPGTRMSHISLLLTCHVFRDVFPSHL